MRTRSPNFMNGVRAPPCAMSSIARRSAMQAEPFAPPALRDRPRADDRAGRRRRVAGGMGDEFIEAEVHLAAVRVAEPLAVVVDGQIEVRRARRCQASPSSSGVTATGAKLEDGLAWKKPKPVRISRGRERAQADVVDLHEQPDARAAERRREPIGTSSTITPNSPSKSMPCASSGSRDVVVRRRAGRRSRPGTSAGSRSTSGSRRQLERRSASARRD